MSLPDLKTPNATAMEADGDNVAADNDTLDDYDYYFVSAFFLSLFSRHIFCEERFMIYTHFSSHFFAINILLPKRVFMARCYNTF